MAGRVLSVPVLVRVPVPVAVGEKRGGTAGRGKHRMGVGRRVVVKCEEEGGLPASDTGLAQRIGAAAAARDPLWDAEDGEGVSSSGASVGWGVSSSGDILPEEVLVALCAEADVTYFPFPGDTVVCLGDEGEGVKALQEMLTENGNFASRHGATGYFGPGTEKAVKEWQVEQGILPSSGVWGPLSRSKYMELRLEDVVAVLGQARVDQAVEAHNLAVGIDRAEQVREATRGGRAMARARAPAPTKAASRSAVAAAPRAPLTRAAHEVLQEEGFTPTIFLGVCLIILAGAVGSWVGSGSLTKMMNARRRRTGLQDGDVNRLRGSYDSFDKNNRAASGKFSRVPMEEALNIRKPKTSPTKSEGSRKPRRPANLDEVAPSPEAVSAQADAEDAAATSRGATEALVVDSEATAVIVEDASVAHGASSAARDEDEVKTSPPSLPPGMPTLADAAAARTASPGVAKPKMSATLPPVGRSDALPMGILITDSDTAKGAARANIPGDASAGTRPSQGPDEDDRAE